MIFKRDFLNGKKKQDKKSLNFEVIKNGNIKKNYPKLIFFNEKKLESFT